MKIRQSLPVGLALWMLAGGGHALVRAGTLPDREGVITWRYMHTPLRVECGLPGGTVVSSMTVPLPAGVSGGVSRLRTPAGSAPDYVMLGTSLAGLTVRAALDRNGSPRPGDEGPQTLLRLELVRGEQMSAGWLTVLPLPLWWEVYDPVTHVRLWGARIVWKGRIKVEAGRDGGPGGGKQCE